ncbi:MAG TPA: hypothetical protein VMU51_24395, partial [Mycobacteriales bacterium]|nr:hypothetical protein [Mycobacteriales bacterium]
DAILDWIAARLARPGLPSAERVGRVAILHSPPDVDAGEMSDKGSINQAIARARRGTDVERLYARSGPGVRVVR